MGEGSSEISRNIEKVARSLFTDELERQRFLDALQRGEGGITAVVTIRGPTLAGTASERPAWLPPWITVSSSQERPGSSDRHAQGEIYCLDLSSTFACAALSEVVTGIDVMIDLCAAPGGKSIVASRHFPSSFIIANEVIKKRTAPLISNYKRCKIDPSIVTSRDPATLAKLVPGVAQLVIVDAPCSGQSLVVKNCAAPGAFHPATISMNARRQRRILACAAEMLKPGGYILYTTCTFSKEENEENIEWFLSRYPTFSAQPVKVLNPFRSQYSDSPSYRLFPQAEMGAGAFCALLRAESVPDVQSPPGLAELTNILRPVWRSPTVFKACPAPSVTGERQKRGGAHEREGKRARDRRERRSNKIRPHDYE